MRICRPKGISRTDANAVLAYAIGRIGIDYDVRNIFDLARLLFSMVIHPTSLPLKFIRTQYQEHRLDKSVHRY